MHFPNDEVCHRMGIKWEKSTHTMGKLWSSIFQTFAIRWVLLHFRSFGNWRGNPCISHLMKYAIGWESNGKKTPKLWEKYEYQFPRLPPCNGFCCISPYRGKLMGKSMHLLYDDIGYFFGGLLIIILKVFEKLISMQVTQINLQLRN